MTMERERREAEVPASSLATRGKAPNEITMRFSEWTSWGMTAYQKGQFAGSLRPEAERIVAAGRGVIVEDEHGQRPAAPRASRRG